MLEEIKVLDKGFVRLVKQSASDADVVDAARVSYNGQSKGEEANRKLIAYLLANDHSSPFEHTYLKFHVKAPIFVVRQWHRHRVGVSYNEVSARYTEVKEEFYYPEKWRAQDVKNKQGSGGEVFGRFSAALADHCEAALATYQIWISQNVAREMARMVLPVNLYTQFYFTCNARSLMHFVRLRSDSHAQWETQRYSDAMFSMFRALMPWTAEAFLATLDRSKYAGIAWQENQKA